MRDWAGSRARALAVMLVAMGAATAATAEKVNLTAEVALAAFFADAYEEYLGFHPQEKTDLGRKDDGDKLDDLSARAMDDEYQMWVRQGKELQAQFQRSQLTPTSQLSYDLFLYLVERRKAAYRFRYHDYLVEHKNGPHTSLPVFMANKHAIDTAADADAYISRLRGFEPAFRQVVAHLKEQAIRGITPPRFVMAAVIRDVEGLLTGYPLKGAEADKAHPLWADFTAKLAKLEGLQPKQREKLRADAKAALTGAVKSGYGHLLSYLKGLEPRLKATAGVWKHPDGAAYYQHMLKTYTSLELSADEIHQLGHREVARIHREMAALQKKVGFRGPLSRFFEHVNNRDGAYCPPGDKGREQCLQMNRDLIAGIKARMSEFTQLPLVDDLVVRRVEPFREKSAGFAFYEAPALDHSRPGVYYLNLADPTEVATSEMEALAYHEAIPGHHMQISMAQNLKLPQFRRRYWMTAFGEGWGLYSEYFPKELGFYQDPYSDFGRLSMELWRACRLVVDTGIHAKKWTKEQAIAYLADNTPSTASDSRSSIERYIVWPGQATAYKIGMNKILELRELSRGRLGKDFHLGAFHDQVLNGGGLPLVLLERKIKTWLDGKAASAS